MKYIFFCIPILALAVSCAQPAAPKKLSAECYVRYLVPEGQLRAEATLRTGIAGQNAPQPMEAPGGVRYQQVVMNIQKDHGISYVTEHPGGYTPTHTFSWKDDQNKTHVFNMEMAPVTAFSFGGSKTLSRGKPATFTWDGAPLEKGEGLIFMWERAEDRLTVPMEVVGTPGQTRIEFPAAKLSELSPGEWTLYLVRKKLTEATEDGIDVSGLIEFYTNVDTLQVK